MESLSSSTHAATSEATTDYTGLHVPHVRHSHDQNCATPLLRPSHHGGEGGVQTTGEVGKCHCGPIDLGFANGRQLVLQCDLGADLSMRTGSSILCVAAAQLCEVGGI